MREAVIVSTARTPLGKAFRGAFNDTEAPAMGGHVVRAATERAGIDPAMVDDVLMGAAAQQGTQAYNLGRLCAVAGGLPETTSGMTMDRQCSSGLMTIATAAKPMMIATGSQSSRARASARAGVEGLPVPPPTGSLTPRSPGASPRARAHLPSILHAA